MGCIGIKVLFNVLQYFDIFFLNRILSQFYTYIYMYNYLLPTKNNYYTIRVEIYKIHNFNYEILIYLMQGVGIKGLFDIFSLQVEYIVKSK